MKRIASLLAATTLVASPAWAELELEKDELTFGFIKLTDMSGIDTTSSGAPQLYYSTDGGSSWSSTTYGLETILLARLVDFNYRAKKLNILTDFVKSL